MPQTVEFSYEGYSIEMRGYDNTITVEALSPESYLPAAYQEAGNFTLKLFPEDFHPSGRFTLYFAVKTIANRLHLDRKVHFVQELLEQSETVEWSC